MLPASSSAEPSASLAFAATSTSPRCRQRPGRCSDRAGACACGGWVQWQADSGRTGEAGCCAADVEGSIGAAEAAEAACATSAVGCMLCVRAVRAVRIGALGVAVMRGRPRAAVVAWAEQYHWSPSRSQRVERPEWPYPRHLHGKGCMKAAERGGNGVRAASKAWGQAHWHLCVNV